MPQSRVSTAALRRLPIYLNYLKSLPANAPANISATTLAGVLDMGEVQVRKDLAAVSTSGKPRIGYIVEDLVEDLEEYLGYKDVNNAIIVGAGKLGRALLDYSGFEQYGLHVAAAFDAEESRTGQTESGKQIFPMSRFEELCDRMKVRIGIITVPALTAQRVCDEMIRCGILAIWNFAPVHLNVPETILVQNENMAASLAMLSKHLNEKIKEK
jgi:redox-sensing transcriptional repressor